MAVSDGSQDVLPGMERVKGREVFVIGPIGSEGTAAHQRGRQLLEHVIRRALPRPEWVVRRADEEASPDSITPRVIQRIHDADLVVADLSDQNPNAFYELAVAHGYRRPVVSVCDKDTKLPFDNVDTRTIFFDLSDLDKVENVIARIQTSALQAVSGEPLHNPLIGAEKFFELSAAVGTDEATRNAALIDVIASLSSRVSNLQESFDRAEWRSSGKGLPRKNGRLDGPAKLMPSEARLTTAELEREVSIMVDRLSDVNREMAAGVPLTLERYNSLEAEREYLMRHIDRYASNLHQA